MRDDVCNYLIVIHAYTGFDTVSAVAGRGKLEALKLNRSEHCQEMFRELGQSCEPSTDLVNKLQAFTCKLYTSSTTTVDINTARHQLFCARRGGAQVYPACTMHANYQAGICRCCLHQHPQVPSPVKHG